MIATCFTLIGFAACIIVGWAAGNPMGTILRRALVGGVVCFIVGTVVGALLARTVDQHVEAYKRAHPIQNENGQPQPLHLTDNTETSQADAAAPADAA